MWLLTFSAWESTREGYVAGYYTNTKERTEAWFCRGSINNGLRLLKARSEKFNRVYGPNATKDKGMVIEYRLLSVAKLPDDTDPTLFAALGVYEINQAAVDSIV
jgi:hypothetical protein